MQEKILILDFGSQFTQLIARRVRELNIYCEIHPYNKFTDVDSSVKGIILSGSPYSVRQEDAPMFEFAKYHKTLPILGVCYGAQYVAHFHGGAGNAWRNSTTRVRAAVSALLIHTDAGRSSGAGGSAGSCRWSLEYV